jgi:hypothetical protein
MKRIRTQAPKFVAGTTIKIRINSRTVITVRSEEAARQWLDRYPGASIME